MSDSRKVIRAFLEKYDLCEPAITDAFAFRQNHGLTYRGPTYEAELIALRALLAGESNSSAAGAGPFGLLPCPFCGSEPRFIEDDSYGACQIFCPREYLGCEAHPVIHMVKDQLADAISAWNRRAGKDAAGEHAWITQASASLARPSSSPSPAVRDGLEKI